MLKDMIALTKPRLLRLNVFAVAVGFWVASKWDISWLSLLLVIIGSTLVIASACVINNYWDRELDQKMERTKKRIEYINHLRPGFVLWYGIILGVAGFIVLYVWVNPLSGWLSLLGWFAYIVIYTMWLKRSSTWSTSLGGIAGAMPPVIGYCAVTNQIDMGAWLLFALLFLWQPPHFWSLGIRRVEEYRAAGFPLLPVVKGIKRTKYQMVPYVFLLLPAAWLLYYYDYVGLVFLLVSLAGGLIWFIHTLSGLKATDDDKWAKVNFLISVNYLMLIFILMVANTTWA
ncbi:heme o synthase [Paenibacillus xylanilyticus]|uniref:Protoheme IX farnesyltransferase n=1 Tax=Paenibacillus xylanilyticus TaxID=248903 RepID=A0A7Y6EWI8_9BACL|nr:heme o synthase [Paenibacillus xylanilyticus]NUU76495.1 protoheme IX farnesyltransferase [Paenibacillus xylanilyticus]